MTFTVALGSRNPVTCSAVTMAVSTLLPLLTDPDRESNVEVVCHDVPSGIPGQPMSDEQAIEGATNRACAALVACDEAVFGVGLEGGLHQTSGRWFCSNWAVVADRSGGVYVGGGSRVQVPAVVTDLMFTRNIELGEADDLVFQMENSKQKLGLAGILTEGVVTRTDIFEEAVLMAFAPVLSHQVFNLTLEEFEQVGVSVGN